jgi:toxin ParE1/3/4
MAAYSLYGKAVADLDGIYEHTISNFGLEQAQAYLLGLHDRFQLLVDNPGVGRSASQLAPKLRRHAKPSSQVHRLARIRAF